MKWYNVEMCCCLRSDPSFVRFEVKPSSRSFWSFFNKSSIQRAFSCGDTIHGLNKTENTYPLCEDICDHTYIWPIDIRSMSNRTHWKGASTNFLPTSWRSWQTSYFVTPVLSRIRSSLTLTTWSYQYSPSLTFQDSSSGVFRSEGEGEEWVRGFRRLIVVCNYPLSYTCGNPSRKWHMWNKESHFTVHNRLSKTIDNMKEVSFRNHVTCRVFQSIIFSLSCFAVNVITCHVHVSRSRVAVNGIELMGDP